MRTNRFLVSVVCMILVSLIALAGCSSANDDGAKNNPSESGEKVSIDIFQFKVEVKDQFEELVKQYEADHPNVTIHVKTVGGGNDYGASLKAAFASGEEPDIFNIGGPSDIAEYRARLADVSGTKSEEEALGGVLRTGGEGDEILGLPFKQEGDRLIYNKSIFDQAGIHPDDIVAYEDFEKAEEVLDSQKEE